MTTQDAMMSDRPTEAGMTLIEVTFAMVMTALAMVALHSTLSASVEGREAASDSQQVHSLGLELLERIKELPFGSASESPATPGALTELFDDDQDLGSASLSQLVVAADQTGHVFGVAANGVTGTWEVRVTRDLDGNGAIDGPRDGRDDLVRIEILFDGRPMFETFRAAAPAETVPDTGAVFSGG